jgi:hypothetical protein
MVPPGAGVMVALTAAGAATTAPSVGDTWVMLGGWLPELAGGGWGSTGVRVMSLVTETLDPLVAVAVTVRA